MQNVLTIHPLGRDARNQQVTSFRLSAGHDSMLPPDFTHLHIADQSAVYVALAEGNVLLYRESGVGRNNGGGVVAIVLAPTTRVRRDRLGHFSCEGDRKSTV